MAGVQVKPKVFRYAVDLGEDGHLRNEEGEPLADTPGWTPEHFLLAGVIRCSLKSLRYHAKRAGIEVTHATGTARGVIEKRETDGRFGLVETVIELDVHLEPRPGEDELAALLAKAERDCFVGASLVVPPIYRWTMS